MPYYLNSNGLKLYYEFFNGHKDGIPIVMIHGFGSSAGFFHEQIKVLKKNRILVFDAEGHGKSEKNPNENLDVHLVTDTVSELSKLLEILNIEGQVGIIGHSLVGGGIGQKFALLHPEKIKFLILLNSGTMYIDNPIRNTFWNLLPQMVRMNFNEIIIENLEILLDKTIPFIRKAIIDEFPKTKDQNGFFFDKLDGKIETEIFDMIQHPLDPSGIKCNSLIIGAELDDYAPLWMSKKLAQNIEGSEFEVITMAGHFGPSHRAGAYNVHILKFLQDLNILNTNH